MSAYKRVMEKMVFNWKDMVPKGMDGTVESELVEKFIGREKYTPSQTISILERVTEWLEDYQRKTRRYY